jgi:hypothetical protein
MKSPGDNRKFKENSVLWGKTKEEKKLQKNVILYHKRITHKNISIRTLFYY